MLNPYVLLGMLLAAIGLFGGGYYEGHKSASNSDKAAVLTKVVTQVKYLPAETKRVHDQVVHIKTVHDKVYVDVVKTVPDNRVCDVAPAAIVMLNANRGTLPASH